MYKSIQRLRDKYGEEWKAVKKGTPKKMFLFFKEHPQLKRR